MKIKKGDTVKVITGKDKGKTGKVLQSFPELNRGSVAGINISYKHLRSNKRGQAGQRVEFSSPVRLSNVALLCPHCSQSARVGYKISADKKHKDRICQKCQTAL